MEDKFFEMRSRLADSLRGPHVHTLSELLLVVRQLIDVVAGLEEKINERCSDREKVNLKRKDGAIT
jgi:hypothetical protein